MAKFGEIGESRLNLGFDFSPEEKNYKILEI